MTASRIVFCEHLTPASECRIVGCRGSYLTPREAQVMDLLVDGLIRNAIAHELGVSRDTVDNHLKAAYRKLGVDSQTGAVREWMLRRLPEEAHTWPDAPEDDDPDYREEQP